jgi:hypothetical protein
MAATKLIRLKYKPSPLLETVSKVTMEMMMKTTFTFIDTAYPVLDPAATKPANTILPDCHFSFFPIYRKNYTSWKKFRTLIAKEALDIFYPAVMIGNS